MLKKLCFYFVIVKVIRTYTFQFDISLVGILSDVAISANRQIMAYHHDSTLILRKLSQTYNSYDEFQSFSYGFLVSDIKISKDLSSIAVTSAVNNSMQIYQKNINTNYYELNQSLIINQPFTIEFSQNSEFLFVGKRDPEINIFKRNSGGGYISSQNLTVMNSTNVIWTDSNNIYMLSAGDDMQVRLYQNINGQFIQFNWIFAAEKIKNIWASDDLQKVIVVGYGSTYKIYLNVDGIYSLLEEVATSLTMINTLVGNRNGTRIGYFDSSDNFIQYASEQANRSYTLTSSIQIFGQTINSLVFEQSGSLIFIGHSAGIRTYFECVFAHCLSCNSFACSVCENGFVISSIGLCQLQLEDQSVLLDSQISSIQNSICSVQRTEQGFCQKYCDKTCSQCQFQEPQKCITCSLIYTKDQNGQCILQNQSVQIVTYVNPFVSAIRHSKTKVIFLFLTDIWLYQYHKPNYTGIMEHFLETVRMIQSKRDQFIGMDRIPYVSSAQQMLKRYDLQANPKYLVAQRRDDSVPQNITNFVLQVIPFTLIMFLLIRILFRMLFNYSISSYLRPLSFAGCVFVSLLEGNIEYFVFLGARNLQYLFAEKFSDKLFSVFVISFLFIFVFYSFGSYFLLYYFYEKLFKYFLTNLFRIDGASWIMLCIYCTRPFISGCIHALLYHNHTLQLFLLGSLDLSVFFAINAVEMKTGIHKSKLSLMCMNIYLLCGVPFNGLMRLIVVYKDSSVLMQIFDTALILVLFSRGACVVLSALFQIIQLYKCKKTQKQVQLDDQLNENNQDQVAGLHPNLAQEKHQKKQIMQSNKQSQKQKQQDGRFRKKCIIPTNPKQLWEQLNQRNKKAYKQRSEKSKSKRKS